jgi:hypothetical protein
VRFNDSYDEGRERGYKVGHADGFRAGIEAAAKWHERQAAKWRAYPDDGSMIGARILEHEHYAKAIRALLDEAGQ